MTSVLTLLYCASFLLYNVLADVPISTQAIVETVYAAGDVSTSYSTDYSTITVTSTIYDTSTYTSTGTDGVGTPVTTTDSSESVYSYVSTIVNGVPVTAYNPTVTTIGSTTIYGADSSSNAPAAAASSSAAQTSANQAPAAASSSTSDSNSERTSSIIETTSTLLNGQSTVFAISTPGSTFSASPASTTSHAPASGNSQKGLSTGAKAAIGTAAVIVAIFLTILFFWLNQLRRKRRAFIAKHGEEVASISDVDGFFSPEIDTIPKNPGVQSSERDVTPIAGPVMREKRDPYAENIVELPSGEPVRSERPLGPSYRNSQTMFRNSHYQPNNIHGYSESITALPSLYKEKG